jgi:hypothetical protein
MTRSKKASAIIALLDATPKPVLPAEYLEAADSEPSPADAEAISVFVGEEPSDAPTYPCPHCAGTGWTFADRTPPIPEPAGPHALDSAPINAKIVVVLLDGKSHAVLAGPAGAKELPVGDVAHRLPEGARIRKIGEREFMAEQMNATEDHAPITRESAGRAIADFVAHFHPNGLSR